MVEQASFKNQLFNLVIDPMLLQTIQPALKAEIVHTLGELLGNALMRICKKGWDNHTDYFALGITVRDWKLYLYFKPVDGHSMAHQECSKQLLDMAWDDYFGDFANDPSQIPPHMIMSLRSFRRIFMDYCHLWDQYNEIVLSGLTQKLEAIDMGRRGLHNEGAEQLQEALTGKLEMGFDTARLFFSLICLLHCRQHFKTLG